MSTPVPLVGSLAEVAAQLSASSQPRASITGEVVLGRVVLVDHAPSSGHDHFASRCFELTETGETLDLTKAIRVHEEIRLHRTRRIRSQVVGTTLRRQMAEIVEADGPDITP